jgi:hypothetical protein
VADRLDAAAMYESRTSGQVVDFPRGTMRLCLGRLDRAASGNRTPDLRITSAFTRSIEGGQSPCG